MISILLFGECVDFSSSVLGKVNIQFGYNSLPRIFTSFLNKLMINHLCANLKTIKLNMEEGLQNFHVRLGRQ